MNYQQIVQNQFNEQINREGKTVLDYSQQKKFQVLFRKFASGKGTQERRKIYYDQSNKINKGDILEYEDRFYILINQDSVESDIYIGSVLNKCNEIWNVSGIKTPLVIGDLDAASPKVGQVTSTVNGYVTFYTKYTEDVMNAIQINNAYYTNGGVYKVVNTYIVDGLLYIYLTKTVLSSTESYIITNNAKAFTLNVNQKVQQGWYVKSQTTPTYLPEAKLTFTSSDPTIAYIDKDDFIVPLKAGKFDLTIDAAFSAYNGTAISNYTLTTTQTYTVLDGADTSLAEITYSGKSIIYHGGDGKIFTGHYYKNGVEDTTVQPSSWTFQILLPDKKTPDPTYTTGTWVSSTYLPEGTTNTDKIKATLAQVKGYDFNSEEDTFKVTVTYPDGTIGNTILDIDVY